jgi:hypothetical protein
MNLRTFALVPALLSFPVALASAGGLSGSPASMVRQHSVALAEDYSFLRDSATVAHYVDEGRLVHLTGNADYRLAEVSFPFARPEVAAFVAHFAAQYHEATGTRLVVTSLTRPLADQPANAHRLSVHPAGMAVDLRVPATGAQREWLEGALLAMEKQGMLDVTREKHPPHYHVAVFREAIGPWLAERDSVEAVQRAVAAAAADAARRAEARVIAANSASLASAHESWRGILELAVALAIMGIGVPAARLGLKRWRVS